MSYFPLFLKIEAPRTIVIIGGGSVALGKVEGLLPHAKALHLVAEAFTPSLHTLLGEHAISHQQASYASEQLVGAALVIAATDDAELNHRIYADAKARGALVNVVDDPAHCDVIFPAIVRRGEIQIAISSSGVSPVLARLIKQWIERLLPWNFSDLAAFSKAKREQVKAALGTLQKRRLFWHNLLEGALAEEVLQGNLSRADALFERALELEAPTAALYLIGAGAGDPDLLTIKAIRLLSKADVVLYDRLVAPSVLEMYARKEASKIPVGKAAGHHHKKQGEIGEIIRENLRKGKVVVRLKGGDPSLFAHGAEEAAIAREMGVPCQIVPGITAATGCAATMGIPLTERGGAQAVRFLTLYSEVMGTDAFWQTLRYAQQETLVFYMATAHRNLICEKLIELGFLPHTPIVAVEQGTTPQHREYAGTLESFPRLYAEHVFASPTLIIVGAVVGLRQPEHGKEPAPLREDFFSRLPKAVQGN